MTESSSALVRRATDARVVEALMRSGAMSRAALADTTGLSRPTASAAAARLLAAGVLVEPGERTPGPGRRAALLQIAPGMGAAAALAVSPDGIRGRLVDVHGRVLADEADGATTDRVLRDVARALERRSGRTLRTLAVSLAEPVDRRSFRPVRLPDAPFAADGLDPAAALRGVGEDLVVDNDVNWSAMSVASAYADRTDCIVLLHLGAGLGAAVIEQGRLVRGHRGLAGELAHLIVPGVAGGAVPLVALVEQLGLHRPGTRSIDVDAARALLKGGGPQSVALAQGLAAVVAAVVGLLDPGALALAGPWGAAALEPVRHAVEDSPRPVPLECVHDDSPSPPLAGALDDALRRLRVQVVADATDGVGR